MWPRSRAGSPSRGAESGCVELKDLMTSPVQCIAPGASLAEAARAMGALDVGALAVAKDGKLVGILTDRDLAIRGVAQGLDPGARVEEVMTPQVVSAAVDTPIRDAVRMMEQMRVRRLVITDSAGAAVGIVSLGDLAQRLHRTTLPGELLKEVTLRL